MIAELRGDYDGALDWYRQSLTINEELGNRAGIATSYGQMGVLLTNTGQPADAIPHTIRALAIHPQLGSTNVSTDLHWLGRQRELLGPDEFTMIAGQHLDPDSLTKLTGMLDR